jgi:glucan phosphoethanolaminetransferase (alkaline phosphatase superfamily)
MTDLPIEPPEESEQETLFGTIFLRLGAVFLSALLGFVLVLLGYMFAIVMNLELEEFNAYTSIYFSVSIAIWILIGLFMPFARIQRFFEELKGVTFGRIIVFVLVIGTFVILHWYVITIATELLVSVFGTD